MKCPPVGVGGSRPASRKNEPSRIHIGVSRGFKLMELGEGWVRQRNTLNMPSCWVAFVCKTSLLNTFSVTHIVAAYTIYCFTWLLHSFLCVLGWLINAMLKIWNKVKWILILVSMFPFLLQDQPTRWYQSWQLRTQYSDGPDKKVTFGHKIPPDMPLGSTWFLGCYRCAETHTPDFPF